MLGRTLFAFWWNFGRENASHAVPGPFTVLVGLVVTAVALLTGILLTKTVLARHNGVAGILAGGMTSSPALAVLTGKGVPFSVGQFSFAYFGALTVLMLTVNLFVWQSTV